MKISKAQFQAFLDVVPSEAWAVIYSGIKDPNAIVAMRGVLFDEAGHARHLAEPRIRGELISLATHHAEIRAVLVKAATKYYIKRSWRRWLPWNWF